MLDANNAQASPPPKLTLASECLPAILSALRTDILPALPTASTQLSAQLILRLLIWDHSSSVKCGTSGFSILCEAEQTAAEASNCDG